MKKLLLPVFLMLFASTAFAQEEKKKDVYDQV